MGMFDRVIVECPYCHNKNEVQSKSGDCTLSTYDQNNVPIDVAADLVNTGISEECISCKKYFMIGVIPDRISVKTLKL